MTAASGTPACRSHTRYGRCGLTHQHDGFHAVPIGDGVWYGYERGGKPLGYGHLTGGTFQPTTTGQAS